MQTNSLSVMELTTYIRDLMEVDPILHDVWVVGEVSNMKAAASGHWYFTVKDSEAQLRCVMFRYVAQRQFMIPQDGDSILVHGKISVYEARGEYQLYADEIQPAGGIGDLYQQFEALKEKLSAEGLFDEEIKRPLPPFPKKIGIVTSPDAAAFQDVQNVLRRRFPIAELILSPTLVQGSEAPMSIVQAIGNLNTHTDVDIIIICRGGGSIEDLWAFNDERVAITVSASKIPTISGVGHETDFTIVDFVADVRAPTPSAAAEIATPDLYDFQESIRLIDEQIEKSIQFIVNGYQMGTQVLTRTLQRVSPEGTIRNLRQRVDDLDIRLMKQQRRYLSQWRERVEAKSAALQLANPGAILARGYAIVTRVEDGVRVLSHVDARPGTAIEIQLHQSILRARTEDEETNE